MEGIKLFFLNNKKIFIILGGIVLFILIYLSCFNEHDKKDSLVYDEILAKDVYTPVETQTEYVLKDTLEYIEEYIAVDIKGQIRKPGVYRVLRNADRRVNDIITMAGGLLNDADTSVSNLSKKVFDEMVIVIYSKDEVKNFLKVEEEEKIKNESCIKNNCDSCLDVSLSPVDDKEKSEKETSTDLVNINTASKEELMNLKGIGESKAIAIIEYRTNKPFEKIEDIMNVSGIGESVYNKIKDNITI